MTVLDRTEVRHAATIVSSVDEVVDFLAAAGEGDTAIYSPLPAEQLARLFRGAVRGSTNARVRSAAVEYDNDTEVEFLIYTTLTGTRESVIEAAASVGGIDAASVVTVPVIT